jgi:hypothetical protein
MYTCQDAYRRCANSAKVDVQVFLKTTLVIYAVASRV